MKIVKFLALCGIVEIFLAGYFIRKNQSKVIFIEKPITLVQRVEYRPVVYTPAPKVDEWVRPNGMAPQAFEAYLASCKAVKVSPVMITQTIGNHPLSAGYHRKDGTLVHKGKRIDYTTAVDLDVIALNRRQINHLLREMKKRNFAAWYREGKRWKNGEHVHAVYMPLPMKPQLREQIAQFRRENR